MANFNNYIKSVRAGGHLSFTLQDVVSKLGISPNAVNCGVYKLKKKGDIITPVKNLHVIIPPEYQSIGCLPAPELIPILMKHLKLSYYVCLLSAAVYHAASHQKPQIFQVMINKQLKSIVCGKVKIHFIYKKLLEDLPIQKVTVKTGYLNVATPELIALDALLYPKQAGGLNHIATLFSELVESLNVNKLVQLLDQAGYKSCVQRLGYILEHIETLDEEKKEKIINGLDKNIKKRNMTFIALASELPTAGQPKDNRWMIIENTNIENDL
jgi:predicted transcriptional regulator of viral defense system